MNLKYYAPDLTNDDFCTSCRKIFPHQLNMSECEFCNKKLVKCYTRYDCDECIRRENFDYDKEPTNMFKTTEGDICNECFSTGKFTLLVNPEDLIERYDTIHYKQIYSNRFSDIDVYVIYEHDNVPGIQHCEYYLLCVRDGKIILNYIIDTYNPYFGVYVISCDVNLQANTVNIKYREKHKIGRAHV